MTVPERTGDQRLAALEQAQQVRRVQAQIKQMLKTGEIGFAEVLDRAADKEEVARLRVVDVLRALPRMGPVRSQRLMERLDIAPSRRLRGLGDRQRRDLLDELS